MTNRRISMTAGDCGESVVRHVSDVKPFGFEWMVIGGSAKAGRGFDGWPRGSAFAEMRLGEFCRDGDPADCTFTLTTICLDRCRQAIVEEQRWQTSRNSVFLLPRLCWVTDIR